MSNRSPDPDFERDGVDLFTMPSSGGGPVKLNTVYGKKSMPSYSPDGSTIAYFGTEGRRNWYKNQGLWIVPADGSGKSVNLTEPYDVHVDPTTINDTGTPEIMPPTWSNDGTKLYFPIMRNGRSVLCLIGVGGDNFQPIVGEQGVVGSYSFDSEQTHMAYFMGKMDDPGQIYINKTNSKKSKTVSKFNKKLFKKIDLGEVEEVWIQGPDENDLQGWILKPPGFDPKKKYPSILEIHGGPLTQYGEFFMHEFYYLAAAGYVVHFCNPRGGQGYGEEHAKAIWGGWGDADYRDLMTWTDFIEGQPYISKERMGVTGGSYGGYMSVWIIGHTDRFKAAVPQRCVSNLVSMWGSSDLNWIFQEVLNDKPPFEDLEKYWQHSPIKYIGNAVTPTLVIHSENDLRCPIEQGEQVFVALKSQGVDSEMVRFPEEFHGLSRNGRTDRRIVRLNHIVRWFDKYLK
jgi:dipeptidyl aminopeptidase/acylaminoacyl peptidase